jgi:hypothetical protein
MKLKSYRADGTPTTVLRLGRLFPESSKTTLINDTSVLIDRFGVEQELQQHGELISETTTK